MAFVILSIDGGGTRGVIPIQALKKIEDATGRPIAQCFNLIAGTSTGGLLACALTVSENKTDPMYTLDDIEKLYLERSARIFPSKLGKSVNRLAGIVGPRFTSLGLKSVLREYFKEKRVSDCLTPILVTSYDVRHNEVKKFTSRYANRWSAGFNSEKNFSLVDICLATSAAPTYFQTHEIKHESSDIKRNCVDGGIYVNNPTMMAISEVLKYKQDPIYNSEEFPKGIELQDIYVLSIGTGITPKVFSRRKVGYIGWGVNIVDIMMNASSKSVDDQVKSILGSRYLRFNVGIDPRDSDFTNSSKVVMNRLISVATQKLNNKVGFERDLSQFLTDVS